MVNLGNIYENLVNCVESDSGRYQVSGNVVFMNRSRVGGNKYIDYQKAAAWYKKAYKGGSLKGAFNYATMLHFGRGVDQDHKKAYAILIDLLEEDYLEVYFYMGLYHQQGFAVEKDYDLARSYYMIGAEKGDPYCYNQLGVMYAEGLGVRQDYNFAFMYYQIAAEGGDSLAMANLGWCYESGQGVEADIDTAINWYKKGAEGGEDRAVEGLKRLQANIRE